MATRQPPTASRPTSSAHMICSCFFIMVAVVAMPTLANRPPPPSTLVLYLHNDLVPPDATQVEVASPSGNLAAQEFGSISVSAAVLRETAAPDSAVLGVNDGLVVVEKGVVVAFLAITYVVNTTSFAGSISAQGVEVNLPGPGELAITGGTLDFRFAKGYIVAEPVSGDLQNEVVKLTFNIKYD